MRKKRVVVLVKEYPQLSETYIKNEVDELAKTCEIEIVTTAAGNYPYRDRHPHIVINRYNEKNVIEYLRRFKPDVLHAHYLTMAPSAVMLSRLLNIPFTIRCHSFDVSGARQAEFAKLAQLINSDSCIGLLVFPYAIGAMRSAGFDPTKLHPAFPVVKTDTFLNPEDNGHGVMNVGAVLPKKNMTDFIDLSKRVAHREFNLYAMGYGVEPLAKENTARGGRVNFIPPLEPEAMPFEYKKHEWLVYTASTTLNTVGWPVAIAEAQASGVGVCMQRTDNDLTDYVGDAGFFFNTLDEAAEIISKPFCPERRELGFQLAGRSSVVNHCSGLGRLWCSRGC